MDYEHIAFDVADNIATITLDRPEKLNAFTLRMQHELIDAFDRVDGDDDVRAVIVTGRGRAFCAGADLSAGADTFDAERNPEAVAAREAANGSSSDSTRPRLDEHETARYPRDGGGQVTLRIFECTKPVIGAINGPAVGVGVTMTLPMDIRLASDQARFGFVFARRGLVPEAASSWFLPRVVGISRALEWCMTGRVFGAEEALAGGLVRSLHPADELLPTARALAAEIVREAAPVSVALTRQLLWRMLGAAHPMDAHRIDSRGIYSLGRAADAREGVMAFLEKRPASWTMAPGRDMPEWYPWWEAPEFS